MTQKTFEGMVSSLDYGTIEIEMGGHVFLHTFESSDDALKNRAKCGIFGASVYDISKEDVLERIKNTLLDPINMSDILDWLNDDSDGDDWVAFKSYPILMS